MLNVVPIKRETPTAEEAIAKLKETIQEIENNPSSLVRMLLAFDIEESNGVYMTIRSAGMQTIDALGYLVLLQTSIAKNQE